MVVELSSTQKEASLLEEALTGFLRAPLDPSARSNLETVLAHTELPARVWRMPMIRWSHVDATTALVASDFFTACELARYELSSLRAALGAPIDTGLTLAVELDDRCRIIATGPASVPAGNTKAQLLPQPAVLQVCDAAGRRDESVRAGERLLKLLVGTEDHPGLAALGRRLGERFDRLRNGQKPGP